jgi:trimethylamine:corrinoid methyltransferase-like protein
MAIEVIKRVGIRNHFLLDNHTVDNIRNFRLPVSLRQKNPDGKNLEPKQAAFQHYKKIVDEHYPEPLPDATENELQRILSVADKHAERIN